MNNDVGVRVIGSMDNTLDGTFESANRVYDTNGLSPTIPTGAGGGHLPKILRKEMATKYSIVASRGRDRGNGWEQEAELNSDGITNTITSVAKDNFLIEKGEVIIGGLQEHQHPRKDGICPSITAACGMGGGQTPLFTEKVEGGGYYRIRKLTPRECGRLMGVLDGDIDKMSAVNSNTQLYKQFGNSIVVDVMCAMFRNLNIEGVEKNG